jgi:hypothetical protein
MDQNNRQKVVWLALGIVVGLCVSYVWPHETVYAGTADSNDKFTIMTIESGGVLGTVESVFILDFLTSQLVGATIDPSSGKFTRFYARNIAADFGIRARAKPVYAMAGGRVPFAVGGQQNVASGCIYISELASGRVGAYAYPFDGVGGVLPGRGIKGFPIVPMDSFPFREVSVTE